MKVIKKVFTSILLLVFIYLSSMPLWPFYYKLFVPFPKLEEATVFHGILSAEGKSTWKTNKCNTSLRYYVTDETGKHEIYYGLPGCREYVLSHAGDNRAIGTFWFHPAFGVIQSDYLQIIDPETKETGKERFFASYERKRELFEQQFDYKNTFTRGIPFLLLLIYLVYSATKIIRNIKVTK